jgi:hypothetical protein
MRDMRIFFIFSICDILIHRPLEPPFYLVKKHVLRNRGMKLVDFEP